MSRNLPVSKNKDLANARNLEEVLEEFVKFSEGCVLVAHNASFDVNFINSECTRILGKPIDAPNLCTLKMSKFLVRECNSHKLEAMAEFFRRLIWVLVIALSVTLP